MIPLYSDEFFMREAFKEAQRALQLEEVPVGAVIVAENKIIARAHNLTEQLHDVTAHAEMQAITSAANAIGGKYLKECTLYVTLEPCIMCAGALGWSQITKIVYGAADPRKGFQSCNHAILHPKTQIQSGVLAQECEKILQDFFQSRRK